MPAKFWNEKDWTMRNKSGLKSTEFWVTIASVALKLFYPDFPDEALAATGAYVVSRGIAKIKTPQDPPVDPVDFRR
jgi:hypothetical protein